MQPGARGQRVHHLPAAPAEKAADILWLLLVLHPSSAISNHHFSPAKEKKILESKELTKHTITERPQESSWLNSSHFCPDSLGRHSSPMHCELTEPDVY